MPEEWILCPICGNKTRNKCREDTVFDKVWRDFLCVGLRPLLCCLSEAVATYIASWISEDNLLKKFLLVHGTFIPSKQMPNFYLKEV